MLRAQTPSHQHHGRLILASIVSWGLVCANAQEVFRLDAASGCPEIESLIITPPSSDGLPEGLYRENEIVTVCRQRTEVKCDLSEEWLINGHAVPDDANGCVVFIFWDSDMYLRAMPMCDCQPVSPHAADVNANWQIEFGEVLRLIQLFNSDGYHCSPGTEDGYGVDSGERYCFYHHSDFEAPWWNIGLSELLQLIQLYNSTGYFLCFDTPNYYCPL